MGQRQPTCAGAGQQDEEDSDAGSHASCRSAGRGGSGVISPGYYVCSGPAARRSRGDVMGRENCCRRGEGQPPAAAAVGAVVVGGGGGGGSSTPSPSPTTPPRLSYPVAPP